MWTTSWQEKRGICGQAMGPSWSRGRPIAGVKEADAPVRKGGWAVDVRARKRKEKALDKREPHMILGREEEKQLIVSVWGGGWQAQELLGD